MNFDFRDYEPTRLVAGVLFILLGLAFFLHSLQLWRLGPVDVWPLFLIAFGTAVFLGKIRRSKVEEDRSAQLAVAEERVRIARELHDIVAHGVSLMTIQIAAARRVAQAQPEAAEQSLRGAEETGRQSLAQLQGMLSMLRGADASIGAAGRRPGADPPDDPWSTGANPNLRPTQPGRRPWPSGPWSPPGPSSPPGPRRWRPADTRPPWRDAGPPPVWTADPPRYYDGVRRDPPPRLADLDNLVAAMRQAGLDINMIVVGKPPSLSPGTELVIYRIIQEALTNAMRHAPEAQVSLELTYAPDHVVVFVDDDGPGASAARTPAGGHGLMGMFERVAAVGGTVTAGPRQPGPGWRVHAHIPVMGVMGATA